MHVEKQFIKKFKPKYNCYYNPDYENGVNRPWFTFIVHWKSYELVAKECGIPVGSVKRILSGKPNKKDDVDLVNNVILTREKQSLSTRF